MSTRRRRILKRVALGLGITTVVSIPVLWIAIHNVPGFASWLADTGRSVVGNDAIAWLEEAAYGVEDSINRATRSDEKPQAYWDVPSGSAAVAAPPPDAGVEWQLPVFKLDDLPPVHESWSAPGDGVWVPLKDARRSDDPPRMYKTLLHPDANRSWSAVAVVALDLRTVDIELVAGRYEPRAETEEGKKVERPAVIPEAAHETLLAAFNGGYKATHGHYGMRVDGVTLLPPKKQTCAIAKDGAGKLLVDAWENLQEDSLTWWRQTPACMYQDGKLHPGLTVKGNLDWGATIDGETVIRRSAIAVSEDGNVLFVGIGDHVTAPNLALAMRHTGAKTVAQLDINWSYPKFVTYGPDPEGGSALVATALVEGFEYTKDEYIRDRAPRDFFYVTRKGEDAIRALLKEDG